MTDRKDLFRLLKVAPADAFAESCVAHVYHPVNTLVGRAAIIEHLLQPMARAFPDVERRDDIFLAGRWKGAAWVAASGHYAGTFRSPFAGIPPTGRLAQLRFGEVLRVADGRIVEAYCHLDFLDLMRQAGVDPLPPSRGAPGLFPAPRGHDGLLLDPPDPATGAASLAAVEAMIAGLRRYDRKSLASMGQEAFWDRNMMWYGPHGIGSTRALAGFQAHHQAPFLHAFPDRRGGDHKARFGDGAYVVSTGWPSVRATFSGDWLGAAPTGRPIEMRVMDIWRNAPEGLAENWVFIDIPHVLLQGGVDLFAHLR